ncbi:MAG: winged helix DNA-binding domain-containing protein [Solirubrobacterales bacterium]|nr:winged helix DNA-binding domain-containing protein [Solirubrobacterales bacterium]
MAAEPARTVDAAERRARLARRHALAPAARAADPVAAADAVVALHATDPATVYLSVWARTPVADREALARELYVDRGLVRLMAMRRTLWVAPRATVPAVQAGASARVAGQERRRLIRDVERAGLHRDGARWWRRASRAVLDALAGGREATSTELRAELAPLAGTIRVGEGTKWGADVPIAPRVLTVLSAEGLVVRSSNAGGWTASRPLWALTEAWLGAPIEPLGEAEATAALVARWLRAFGPGTEEDVRWWLGSTKTAVRRALADVGAVAVDLGAGQVGYLLGDDLDPPEPVEPWAALLPGLDPTTMGWKERDFYLGAHRDELFDRAGNAGPTAWWEGRIVGGWRQDPDGAIELQLLEDVGADARAALAAEADRLAAWIDGARVTFRFPSPLFKRRASSRSA